MMQKEVIERKFELKEIIERMESERDLRLLKSYIDGLHPVLRERTEDEKRARAEFYGLDTEYIG